MEGKEAQQAGVKGALSELAGDIVNHCQEVGTLEGHLRVCQEGSLKTVPEEGSGSSKGDVVNVYTIGFSGMNYNHKAGVSCI